MQSSFRETFTSNVKLGNLTNELILSKNEQPFPESLTTEGLKVTSFCISHEGYTTQLCYVLEGYLQCVCVAFDVNDAIRNFG